MNYVDFGLIKPMINRGKTVEQFLGFSKSCEITTVKWISIYLDKDEYCLDFHEVFDGREEGIDNIYYAAYVVPDDMDGKRIHQTKDFESLIEWTFNNYSVSRDKFFPFDYLNDLLENEK